MKEQDAQTNGDAAQRCDRWCFTVISPEPTTNALPLCSEGNWEARWHRPSSAPRSRKRGSHQWWRYSEGTAFRRRSGGTTRTHSEADCERGERARERESERARERE